MLFLKTTDHHKRLFLLLIYQIYKLLPKLITGIRNPIPHKRVSCKVTRQLIYILDL